MSSIGFWMMSVLSIVKINFSFVNTWTGCYVFFVILFKQKDMPFVPILQNELSNASVLVFANKQDFPDAMPASEVADKLGLYSLGQRRW